MHVRTNTTNHDNRVVLADLFYIRPPCCVFCNCG